MLHSFYITRRLPFSMLDAVEEATNQWSIKVVAVDHMSLDTMYEQDKANMATREDAQYLLVVDALDLEGAGAAVDEMLEEVSKDGH